MTAVREVTQTILYTPEADARGVYGNCLQAAIASALDLDLDAVPHFGAFAWWEPAVRLWLRGRSLDWRWSRASRPAGRSWSGPPCGLPVITLSSATAARSHGIRILRVPG